MIYTDRPNTNLDWKDLCFLWGWIIFCSSILVGYLLI